MSVSSFAQGRNGVLLVEVRVFNGLIGEFGRSILVIVVILACCSILAVVTGMVAVGSVPNEAMGVAPNTGTVAVLAKEITGVGRATLMGMHSVRLAGGEVGDRWVWIGMKGPGVGCMAMPVGGDGTLGMPIWALAATAALMASSR